MNNIYEMKGYGYEVYGTPVGYSIPVIINGQTYESPVPQFGESMLIAGCDGYPYKTFTDILKRIRELKEAYKHLESPFYQVDILVTYDGC